MPNIKYATIILTVLLLGCQAPEYVKATKHSAQAPHQAVQVLNNTVQEKIQNYLLEKGINGSVTVVDHERVIYNEGIGFSNELQKEKNTAESTYPIASVTKTFVATSIMQLQEKGKLNIEDPISKYLPKFPNGQKIKLIHLLTHTSGLQPPVWHRGDNTPQKVVGEIGKRRLLFPAGSKWDYKDANYMVLGLIVEKVSGMPLHDYIQKNVFAVAGMKDSGFITSQNPRPFSTDGYVKRGLLLRKASDFNSYLLYGCGDIYMTASDLYLYDKALVSGKLVSVSSLKLMLKPGSKANYGLGLYVNGSGFYSHGVLGGWESLHVYHNDRTVIVLLLNIRDKNTDIHHIAADLYSLLKQKA